MTKRSLAALASPSFLLGCAGVEAVRNFEIQRFSPLYGHPRGASESNTG
ncbi:MAG TPA: hypothetical protein PK836_05970 [Syntrophales bacterium]|nr:hypothetical protein [Syntrophales bacterium]HPQ07216.1 hypothetical protein [Syntrophales bacterium]